MKAFFLEIVGITAAMSVIIAVLFLLSRLAGAKFTAKCRYIVWAVVILRLAVPLGMSEGWLIRVELPAEEQTQAQSQTQIMPETEPITQLTPPETTDLAPAYDFKITETAPPAAEHTPPTVEYPTIEYPVVEQPEPIEPGETLPEILAEPDLPDIQADEKEPISLAKILDIISVVYVIGAALYIIVRISSHIGYTSSVKGCKKRVSAELYEEYHALCESMNIKHHPALYSSDRADSPMLFGYFRPQIVLPTEVTDREEFRCEKNRGILAHELTHYKRGDIWLKLIAMLAEALHWFNPLVHLASRRCEQEMELACDESVLDGMDENARVDYGYAMLDVVKQCKNRQNTLTTQYSPKKSAVKERFENILDTSHKRRGVLIIVLAVILCAAAGLAISCTVETPNTELTAETEPYMQTAEVYHCREGYGGTTYGIYGIATVEIPMSDGYSVTEFDVRYCFDDCEQTDVLSRAVWGYDQAYRFEEYREHSDWNYPTREYVNEIPEDQLDRFSEDQIARLTERVYIYLLTVDENNYAVLKIEPTDKTSEMPENEAELVNEMVAEVEITMNETDPTVDAQAQQLYRQLRELYAAREDYVIEKQLHQASIQSYEEELVLLENRRVRYMNSATASADKNSDNYKALEASIAALDEQITTVNNKIEQAEMMLRSTQNQHDYVERLITDCIENLRSTAPDMLYERYGMLVMLPDEYFNSVTTVPAADLETNEIAKFYQTSVMDQGIGWLFSIVRHTPEEVLTSAENQGGISYFAHDDFYWYAIQTPTDLQVDITSQERTDEYNRLSEMMDSVKSSFKLANDLTIADNIYAEHMVKTYYSQDSHAIYDSMTSADDWNDVIDAPAVREDAAALVNKLLSIYRNGGDEAELAGFLTYPTSDHAYPDGIDVPADVTVNDIPLLFSMSRMNPTLSLALGNGWYMEILLTILDWGSQYIDYSAYDGRDMSIADVYIHNIAPVESKDEEADDEIPLVNVISNDGGLDVNTVILPLANVENTGYRSFRFDDRYSIYLTYNYTRENGNIASYSNIRLYIIDGQSGKIAYQTALETEYLPDWISYTENGCRLYSASVEDGVYTVHCGYLVELTDSGFSIAEAEFEHLPYIDTICRTPNSGVYAAEVIEDGSGDGGIDIIYPGGDAVNRIFENIMLDELEKNEWGEYDLGGVRGYTPIGFLDDEHLVYAVGGWEWHYGYGIFNITTGETVLSGEESPLAVHDGVLFVEDSEIASDGSYETLSSKYYAVTVDGEKKLIASTDEADGVFVLPMDKYTVFEGSTWQMFATGRFNGWNHSDVASDNMTVEVYSPDFSEKLAEIEYPHNYTLVENFITVGNSVTVVVPAVVEDTVSDVSSDLKSLNNIMQSEEMTPAEKYKEVEKHIVDLKEAYTELMNFRSEIFAKIEEGKNFLLRIEAGDLTPDEQQMAVNGAYEQTSSAIESWKEQYDAYSAKLGELTEQYENWRDYRYTLDKSLYGTPSDKASAGTLISLYRTDAIPMHTLMQYNSICELSAVKLNTAISAILAGDFTNEIFEFADVSDMIFPYGAEMPMSVQADVVDELFREFELTEDECYRFEIQLSSTAKLVLTFDFYEYHNETDLYFTSVRLEIDDIDLDAAEFAEFLKNNLALDGVQNGYSLADFTPPTAFVSYYCGDSKPHLYFTLDGKQTCTVTVEIPAEYSYDRADIVYLSGKSGLYAVLELESDGVYTYLGYRDRADVFDGVLSMSECNGLLEDDYKIPDYIKFPCMNYPNMTDDVEDYKTLGVEKDYSCYQMAKEYLANADDYIVWFDGSGIHVILNRNEIDQQYKFIRATDGGDISIIDSFSGAYHLYDRVTKLGLDGSSYIYQAIRAMLMSDGKFMETLTREYSGQTEELFSDFKATMHTLNMTPAGYPSDELALTLTVEQSDIERLPVGTYTIIVKSNFDGLVIERADEDFVMKPDPTTDAEEAIWTWLRAVGMAEIPLDGDMTAEELTNFKRAATEYACRHADGTIESVKNAVKTCFGSEDYFTEEQLMQIDDTHYGVGGHGAARHSYDWLGTTENEAGSVSVKMRFYADANKFVKAKDIEYTLRAVGEDIYGQTIYAFEKCDIIEDYGSKPYFMWT